jgi:hypothetical protein
MSDETNTPEWKIENDDDKTFGIETKRYPNGQIMKRCKLSDGRIAEAKRLKGSDAKEVSRLTGGEAEGYQDAIIAKCLTIDGKAIVPEDVQDMWMDDRTKVTMLAAINFPSAQNV